MMLVKIVNVVSYLFCQLILLVIRPEIKIDPSILIYRKKSGQGLIMISNHKSLLDPWVICASLPPKTFFSLMPVRIMGALDFADPTANWLNKLGIVRIVYYLYGVMGFRQEWTFEEKLAPFINCLKTGGTILVFPEGRLNHDAGVAPFKRGVVHIYNAVPSDILPFAINKLENKQNKSAKKNQITVGIGAITRIPISIIQSEDHADPFPTKSCEFLRQQVVKLYEDKPIFDL